MNAKKAFHACWQAGKPTSWQAGFESVMKI